MRKRLVGFLAFGSALTVVAAASATVPIGADVELRDNDISMPSRPQSSGLSLEVLSCAEPTVSCPVPESLTIRGPRTMKVYPQNAAQRCNVGSPADASDCPADTMVGSGVVELFASGTGKSTAPLKAYATTDTTRRKLGVAVFTSTFSGDATWTGAIKQSGAVVRLKLEDMTLPAIGPVQPVVTEVKLSLDKTKRVQVGGKQVKRHLFGNPSICWNDKWRFRVSMTFSSPPERGQNTSTEPCRAG
jgi:hypothetical protein